MRKTKFTSKIQLINSYKNIDTKGAPRPRKKIIDTSSRHLINTIGLNIHIVKIRKITSRQYKLTTVDIRTV